MYQVSSGFSREASDVWYQTHSKFLLIAKDESLEELFAVIKVNDDMTRIEEAVYGSEDVKEYVAALMRRNRDESTLEEQVIAELKLMQLEYEEGASGTLDVHELFGQTTFYCDETELDL